MFYEVDENNFFGVRSVFAAEMGFVRVLFLEQILNETFSLRTKSKPYLAL